MAVEHGHDQAESLGGGEHQRRKPQAAADSVATVRPACRFDREAGFAEDADVPAGGPLGDAELAGEPVRGNARAALDQLEGEQCPGGGARVRLHHRSLAVGRHNPDADRPLLRVPCLHGYRTLPKHRHRLS